MYNVTRVSFGNVCLHFDINRPVYANFVFNLLIWCFQERFSSLTNPTNLNDFRGKSSPILSMDSFPISREKSLRFSLLFLGLKTIYLVFVTFSVNLLHINHSEAFLSSILAFLKRSPKHQLYVKLK